MNIIYFAGGNRLETLEYITKSHYFTITQIYVTTIETNLESYKNFAKEYGIEFILANKKNILELFNYRNEDLLLSVGYRFIIPEAIFSTPPYAINIHPSLLPKYKGAYSGFAVIKNREKKTGITAHFLDKGIDTGDIINQKVIALNISDSIVSMGSKLMNIEPEFVLKTLLKIKNKNYKRLKQPIIIDEIVFNEKRIPQDSEINPSLPLLELIDEIRACDVERFPAYFMLENKKINIKLEFDSPTDITLAEVLYHTAS